MNTWRKEGREIGGTTAGVIQVPSQARVAEIEIHVNPAGLTDEEVTKTLVQMDQDSNLQDQVIGFD